MKGLNPPQIQVMLSKLNASASCSFSMLVETSYKHSIWCCDRSLAVSAVVWLCSARQWSKGGNYSYMFMSKIRIQVLFPPLTLIKHANPPQLICMLFFLPAGMNWERTQWIHGDHEQRAALVHPHQAPPSLHPSPTAAKKERMSVTHMFI